MSLIILTKEEKVALVEILVQEEGLCGDALEARTILFGCEHDPSLLQDFLEVTDSKMTQLLELAQDRAVAAVENQDSQIVPIAVEPDAGQERNRLTDAERQQRQHNLIMLHIQLIEHASRCISKSCTSRNCAKMKSYLQHTRTCVQGGCKICNRLWTLLRIHAQKCKYPNCLFPQCNAIRDMDYRRRQQRQRNLIKQLIEHASRCNSESCVSTNCATMRSYLQHIRTCSVKVPGGCRICKRIWTLLETYSCPKKQISKLPHSAV